MIFGHKSDQVRLDRMVQCLLATPSDERRYMLMSIFQTGELRLSEADQVIRIVRRLEAQAGKEHVSWPGPADLLPVKD